MTTPSPPSTRTLGFWMCMAMCMGNMIGSGVYMLPASLAPFGWNGVFGWLVTIAGGLSLAFVFASLARALPLAGGPYAYTRAAFGPLASFVVAWSYWVSVWVGNAAIAIGAVGYLSVVFPAVVTIPGLHAALTCAVIWGFTGVSCLGIRLAGEVQVVTTVLKMVPLVVVLVLAAAIVAGDGGASIAPYRPETIHVGAIGAVAAMTMWGFSGLESASVVADKVRDAERVVPRATLLATALTGVIYLFVCSAITLLLPPQMAANSSAPLAAFVALKLGAWAGLGVAIFAAISALGALNGFIVIQGELPWAMARGGVFPRWFARASRRDTPVRAHVVSSILMTLVVMTNYSRTVGGLFSFMALLATAAFLVAFLACAIAAIVLARRGLMTGGALFDATCLFAALFSGWMIYASGREAMTWGAVLLALGIPVHLLMRRYARPAIPGIS